MQLFKNLATALGSITILSFAGSHVSVTDGFLLPSITPFRIKRLIEMVEFVCSIQFIQYIEGCGWSSLPTVFLSYELRRLL